MITVKKLKPEQFARLEQIFREDFESPAPLPQNSEIFGAFENARLVGFVLAERVIMIGQVWVSPTLRNNSTEVIGPLIRIVRDEYDGVENVGAVASEPRFISLFKHYGMGEIPGTFCRKNLTLASDAGL